MNAMSYSADFGRELASTGNENTDTNDARQISISRLARKRFRVARAAPEPTLKQKTEDEDATSAAQYYKVLYTKRAVNKKRKNKSFADGVLEIKIGNSCTLYSEDGKVAARSRVKGCWDMPEGAEIVIGSWEVEVDCPLPATSFRTGQCFMTGPSTSSADNVPSAPQPRFQATGFRQPLRPQTAALQQPSKPQWLHNPSAEGALVLNAIQTGATPVVVDPYICRHLRPHQRDGVHFLYECVMGLRSQAYNGAVLADEMGLGKTLQIIALLWTLLKQGPKGKPALKKCVIVTPSSLTQTWAAEFKKWLGVERLQVVVLAAGPDAKVQVNDFKYAAIYKVLVASYETLRNHTADLTGFCDILVCDEGHRLKASGGSKTMDALLALACRRRILLTGTPLQNNLDEFYALMSFVNPDILGSLPSFKTVFAVPISRSQEPNATAEQKWLGAERSKELSRKMDAFLLRRTSDVIAMFLPSLSSFVVFCRPTELQVKLYQIILKSKLVSSLLSCDVGVDALLAISLLRKLCNHPSLLSSDAAADPLAALQQPDRDQLNSSSPQFSGKLASLESLMQSVLGGTQDRMVVVCSSVMALNIIQAMCEAHSWKSVRIDGATASDQRQDIVTRFNLYGIGQVCLLSTRAGGAGLNLIGANRLVLFDSDWNPAVDLQAMARVWRDGQTKPCVVYRMLTTGTIEEKIYQRQLMKGKLAGVMNPEAVSHSGGFSREELRELFQLDLSTTCNTADLSKGTAGFCDVTASLTDGPLRSLLGDGRVSFVHLSPQNIGQSLSRGDEPSSPAGKEADRDNAPRASHDSLSPCMLGGASQLSLGSPC